MKLELYSERNIEDLAQVKRLPPQYIAEMKAVASVLPFRVNAHVVDNLIDWRNVPNDPIFRLVFPQRDMLPAADFYRVYRLMDADASEADIARAAREIRSGLNPHPAGQLELNQPLGDGNQVINGLQHKYANTLLFFPSKGQTCHAFCNFCFRWAQFVGDTELKMSLSDRDVLRTYVVDHPELTDIIVTGGDPMIMNSNVISRYVDLFLSPEFSHIRNIRFGTKALTFWPFRFFSDPDSALLIASLERLVQAGKHVAIMAHLNHWREIDNEYAHQAIARLRGAGVVIRSQGPLLRSINDDAQTWATMWSKQVTQGIVPYYMFVARDTGAKSNFDVPLDRAFTVFRDAYQSVSGLARTVRGPSMSTTEGKVEITNIVSISGKKYFLLRYLQARDSRDAYRVFFAKHSSRATWFDELEIVDEPGPRDHRPTRRAEMVDAS